MLWIYHYLNAKKILKIFVLQLLKREILKENLNKLKPIGKLKNLILLSLNHEENYYLKVIEFKKSSVY